MRRASVWSALRSPDTGRELRRGAVGLAWAFALVMAFCTGVRWADANTSTPVLIAAATGAPVILLPAWAVLLTAAVFRRAVLAAVAIVLCVAQLHVSWPLLHGGRGLTAAERAPSALRLRVMTLNVKFDVDDGARVSAQVAAADPDIVVLNEFSAVTYEHLHITGYPYTFQRDAPHGDGFAVWSRWPVGFTVAPSTDEAPVHVGFVRTPGRPLVLVQVHTISPTRPVRAGEWRNQLREVGRLLREVRLTTIVAGDFNASRSDDAFAALLGGPGGFADAADGRGYLTTWPSNVPGVPPLLRLDHILVSRGIGVRSVRVLGPTGSDHRAVLADLAVG